MIRQPSFHRRSDAQGFMNTAKIVIREVQRTSRFQVFDFLAESVGEARKPSHHHSHGQILPFDMAGADSLRIGVALHDLGYNLEDWAWGVFRRAVMLAVIAVQLDKLREVHVRTESLFDGLNIESEAVRGDLHPLCETLGKIVYECLRGSSRPLANGEAGNELCYGVNCHKNPSIAKFGGVFFAASFLLLVH